VRHDRPLVMETIAWSRETLRADIGKFRESIDQSQNRSPFGFLLPVDLERGHNLYTRLLGQLRPHLDGVRHVMVVPDGVLLPLPFAALVTSGEGEAYRLLVERHASGGFLSDAFVARYAEVRWLIEDFAISVLPSATTLRLLRGSARNMRHPAEPFLG